MISHHNFEIHSNDILSLFAETESHYRLEFGIQGKEKSIAMLSICNTQYSECSAERLTLREKEIAKKYTSARLREFIASRSLAKKSVQKLIDGAALDDIEVLKGVFDQPILKVLDGHHSYDISISHKRDVVATLVFGQDHPTGIDLELIAPTLPGVFEKIHTRNERKISQNKAEGPIVLYSAKEALSKVLRCGLTAPLHFFEVKEVECCDDIFFGVFRNFNQYRFLALSNNGYILTLVFPKVSSCVIQKV